MLQEDDLLLFLLHCMPYLYFSLNETLGSNVLSVAVVNKTHIATVNPISFVFETSSVC